MLRHLVLALAAVVALGATAYTLISTAADAAPYYRNHTWRPAVRFVTPSFGYNNCYVRRVVPTPFGPRVEWINRCW